jgi:hypothetical protein
VGDADVKRLVKIVVVAFVALVLVNVVTERWL